MIDIESIARPAFVVPYFSNKHEVKMGNPRKNDRFQFLPFHFFDRSGWESLADQLNTAIVNNQNDITNSINGESDDNDDDDDVTSASSNEEDETNNIRIMDDLNC